jgi:hypothetical protein
MNVTRSSLSEQLLLLQSASSESDAYPEGRGLSARKRLGVKVELKQIYGYFYNCLLSGQTAVSFLGVPEFDVHSHDQECS